MPESEDKPKKKVVKKTAAKKKTTTKKKPVKKAAPKKAAVKKTAPAKPVSKPAKKKSNLGAVIVVIGVFLIVAALAVFEFMSQPVLTDPVYDGPNEPVEVRRVRPSTVAGSFYPESKKMLREQVLGQMIDASDSIPGVDVQALLVPHAGLDFSGAVAANAYKTIVDRDITRAIILGPAHHIAFDGVAVASYDAWRTPLGEAVLAEANAELISEEESVFVENDTAFMNENSIEVQIPFLQVLFPEVEIVPLAVGQMTEETRSATANAIEELLDENTILLVSSDLSHYLEAEECEEIDFETIELILEGEQEDMLEIDACGREPILIANLIANAGEWNRNLIDYANTGDVTGDDSRVVGYPAIGYYVGDVAEVAEVAGVSEEQQDYLLELARTTIETFILEGTIYEPEVPEDEFLLQESGVFVTLNLDEELRGCIGHTVAQEALYLAVRDNALAAATEDARFDAVSEEELEDIVIEVSILTEPEEVELHKIQAGVDGVILNLMPATATFLPSVWDQFDNAIEFMEALSVKTGGEDDVWLDENTTFQSYTTISFSE